MALSTVLLAHADAAQRTNWAAPLEARGLQVTRVRQFSEVERQLRRAFFDLLVVPEALPDQATLKWLQQERVAPAERPLTLVHAATDDCSGAAAFFQQGVFDWVRLPLSPHYWELTLLKAEQARQQLQVERYQRHRERESVGELIGDSPVMQAIKEQIRQVAPTSATVLIQGESGTGKELIARAIHQASPRHEHPFIRVNCAAINASLIESEFFGHEKGAFTGANQQRLGRFELADGGTILLDEISEISPGLQAKLLRVLQEREFERVGGTQTIAVDVRVIATTNRNLEDAVWSGQFRQDLYYRLNVFPIENPPLRARKADIAALAQHFVQRNFANSGHAVAGLDAAALAALEAYDWPGNVRELANRLERAVILTPPGRLITATALGFETPLAARGEAPTVMHGNLPQALEAFQPLDTIEREHILQALSLVQGNRTRAAEILGISLRTIRNKLRRYREEGHFVPSA